MIEPKQFTIKEVLALNPSCSKYTDNGNELTRILFEGRKTISLMNVLKMDISHDHKVWIAVRIMTHRQRVMFAGLCALSTEPNYRKQYPDDCRVYDAAMSGIGYAEEPTDNNASAASAWSAWSAWNAARSAASAWSAWSAESAAWSAAWSAASAWSAESAAWSAARSAASAWSAEQEYQLLLIADIINHFEGADK